MTRATTNSNITLGDEIKSAVQILQDHKRPGELFCRILRSSQRANARKLSDGSAL